MSNPLLIKENDYDVAKAGTTGGVNYAVGWGTHVSPEVSQNSNAFVNSKSIGPHSNTAANAPSHSKDRDAEINQIYSKQVTPSPDEVITGLKYELQNMIKKDKGLAKQLVLNNLKKDPHFYGKLGMLGINDKDMMKESMQPISSDKKSATIQILNQMLEAKGKKPETPQSIKDALKDTRERKNQRYNR